METEVVPDVESVCLVAGCEHNHEGNVDDIPRTETVNELINNTAYAIFDHLVVNCANWTIDFNINYKEFYDDVVNRKY